jgi:hypothetical protein
MSDLAFHLRAYLPEATGEELEARVALLKARDWAAALRGRTACPFAFTLACHAHEAAGEFVFAEGETTQRLDFAAKLCRHLVAAAVLAEHLENGEIVRV